MRSRLPLAVGLIGGGILAARERKARLAVERFAAAALETLLNAIDANDPLTGRHVRRVAAYALIIADAAGLPRHRQKTIERVALFHDIGKIHEALFDIVHDGEDLTPHDKRKIATHPERGAKVLAPLQAFYPELPRGVLSHHERWDGTGYPRRLRGSDIPIEARIVSIADTLDAVASTRHYRAGAGFNAALDVIAKGRGTQFDPDLVDLVLLPPVTARLKRERRHPPRARVRRQPGERESVPDISFRWRSKSLGSRDARTDPGAAPNHVD